MQFGKKTVHVLGELQDNIIMEKTGNKSPNETKRLGEELAKKCSKLQKLLKIQNKVLKENQVLKTMQHDMAKELECL